jgi:UDP-N-acetylglucosamine 2-epimerase (non-hydrolysing)
MLDQVLDVFRIRPDYDLSLMQPNQSLTELTSRLMGALSVVFSEVKPALAVVQGDTSTTLCGALAAFFARIPVAHVEAGLRTFDMNAPFPEEANRVLTGRLATLHFAATAGAAQNLVREGIASASVEVTGNTGIDAVLSVARGLESGDLNGFTAPLNKDRRLILVTSHRRENFGSGLQDICKAILRLAARQDVQIVWPVHPNPHVVNTVRATVGACENVHLIEPLSYVPFVDLMRQAYLIITDSGGVQEEAPSLGKPVLVLREKTERPEAVDAGTVKLVGTDQAAIVREAEVLLEDNREYRRMSAVHNPYGDGQASRRIADRVGAFLNARVAVA